MKQQLTIFAECGTIAIADAAQSSNHRYPVPPFASFLETVWRIVKQDYPRFYEDTLSEINLYYNGMQYRWDHAAIRRCFVQHRIDEKELADVMLVTSNL